MLLETKMRYFIVVQIFETAGGSLVSEFELCVNYGWSQGLQR
jgi:hypothetical protein